MLLRYKSFKIKVPPKFGNAPESPESILNITSFSEEEFKKSKLISMGIDPNLSDDELSEYKVLTTANLLDVKVEETDDDIPVLDYIEDELEDVKSRFIKVDEEMRSEYDEKYKLWETGYEKEKTIQLSNDKKIREEQIEKIESREDFVEWTDSYNIEEVQLKKDFGDDIKMEAFKVDDKYILCIEDRINEPQIKHLAESNDMKWKSVPLDDVPDDDDNVMTIYQFIEYVDLSKENIKNVLIDKIVDTEQSKLDNIALGNPNDAFSSASRVEMFSADDVFNSLNNILKND